jgi:hypothetical protein
LLPACWVEKSRAKQEACHARGEGATVALYFCHGPAKNCTPIIALLQPSLQLPNLEYQRTRRNAPFSAGVASENSHSSVLVSRLFAAASVEAAATHPDVC